MFKKLWNDLKQYKAVLAFAFAFGILSVLGLDAHAAGFEEVQQSVTSSMGSLKDAALAILAAVAGVAILLFGGIYAWRYGKKVFSVISK